MQHTPGEKTKQMKSIMAVLLYLLTVLLVFLGFSVLCREDAVTVEPGAEPGAEPGVLDLGSLDFESQSARIILDWQTASIYPGAFYTSADFAEGSVTRQPSQGPPLGDYGTLRLVVSLPPGQVYAIAAKNISFSQRMFVDGVEIGSVGEPADTVEAMTAAHTRYMEGFAVQGETTEIILHYAGFLHANGGGLYPVVIGSVKNVSRMERLHVLFEGVMAAALLTAMLFFFGLFLFFTSRRYLLWFSLLCGCLAFLYLGINNNALLLLLPDVPYPIFLRLAYMGTCWAGLFGALYLDALFPGAANRWAVRGFAGYCAAATLLFALAPTTLFTRYPMQLAFSYVAFLAYLILAALAAARRDRLRAVLTKAEGLLLGTGMGLYIVFAGINAYAHQHAMKFFGWEYQLVGIMVFVFLNLLALTLMFSRTERERDAARAAQEEMAETNRTLERLNHMRALYFANITHEIKTPLAGIQAVAQFCKARLAKTGALDNATAEDLDEIGQRADELAALTGRLLKLSAAQEGRYDFKPLDVAGLLAQTSQAAASVLRERGNRLTVRAPEGLPPLFGLADLLTHVLMNLIANANRACENSEITLSAKALDGGMVELRVADRGRGIPPGLLPRVFTRGVSGVGGTGLGLAICKEAVETHGGHIDIDSQPGQGTQVWLTIPIAKEDGKP